jgi:lambda repressor-like predicted transcriptional regulator
MMRRPAQRKSDPADAARIRRVLIAQSLAMRGQTLAVLGRSAVVSRSLVSHVVAGRKRHRKVEAAIARLAGVRPADLFPPRASRTRNTTKEG